MLSRLFLPVPTIPLLNTSGRLCILLETLRLLCLGELLLAVLLTIPTVTNHLFFIFVGRPYSMTSSGCRVSLCRDTFMHFINTNTYNNTFLSH